MTAILSTLAPVQINGTTYPVLDIDYQFGQIVEPVEHTGQLFPMLQLASGAVPVLTLTMPARAAYDLVGMSSLNVTSLVAWLAKFGSVGTKSTSTDHTSLSLDTGCTGMATITEISANQDGLLTATVQITVRSDDGTTFPIVVGTGSLPSLSSQPVLHTMGPVELQGTEFEGAQGWTIDTAQRIEPIRSDGDLYPTVVAYRGGTPNISIEHTNPSAVLAAIDLIGEAADVDTAVYGRQYDATTGIVSTGSNAMSFTLAGGHVMPESIAAAQDAVASIPLMVRANATTVDANPITVATNADAP